MLFKIRFIDWLKQFFASLLTSQNVSTSETFQITNQVSAVATRRRTSDLDIVYKASPFHKQYSKFHTTFKMKLFELSIIMIFHCFLICFGLLRDLANGNRLGLFNKHHSRPARLGITDVKQIETLLAKSLTFEHVLKRQSKQDNLDRICTVKTCSKCAKYVSVKKIGLNFKHCTVILNTPNCCTTDHFLQAGF